MNVTTSASWNRPPVGIVRVENALCVELFKLLGPSKFKTCIWLDGQFIEWMPKADWERPQVNKIVDAIFPRTASFDIARHFLARAFSIYGRSLSTDDPSLESDIFQINIPFEGGIPVCPSAGDVLLSVGLDWDQPYAYEFYNLSKIKGIKVIACCYDLIPVLFPQYCVGDVAVRFKEYFYMLTWGASAVLCISEQTKRDYLALCEKLGAPERPTRVIPLGDNVPASIGEISTPIQFLLSEPFILFVSTIERRKNHEILYRAYHLLCRSGYRDGIPKLVFVGMPGWGVGDLLKDIELDPLTQGLIIQLNQVNDAELNKLYEHALFCVYPSLYEGWGLPIGEALALKKAVLASDQGSIPEVGGDLVRYLSPWNPQAWADAFLELVTSPSSILDMEQRVKDAYVPRTWSDTAKAVVSLIDEVLSESESSEIVLYPGYDFATQVGLHIGPCIRSTGQNGFLMYGPYRSLKPGNYRVAIFDAPADRTSGNLLVDFVWNGGQTVGWQTCIMINEDAKDALEPILQFELVLQNEITDYEIRCRVDSAKITLSKVVVTSVSMPIE